MVTIMCTYALRQALVKAGEKRTPDPPGVTSETGRLGNWVATLVAEDREIVVAHNERTSLTLVFPFPTKGGFRRAFAARLRETLREYGVATSLAAVECAELKQASLVALRNSPLTGVLDFAAFETAAHSDGQSLRSIQEMVNTSGIERYVPSDAIDSLFGVRRTRRQHVVHGSSRR